MRGREKDQWLYVPERLKLILPGPMKGCLKSESESRNALPIGSGKQKVRWTSTAQG